MVQYQLKGLIRQKKIKAEDVGYKELFTNWRVCALPIHRSRYRALSEQKNEHIQLKIKKNIEHELNLGFGWGASVLPSGIILNKKRIN